MIQKYQILLGLGLLVVGLTKIWMHLNAGATLTLEGCQGGTFSVPIGRAPAHCWGCYVAGLGLLMSVPRLICGNALAK